MAEAVGEDHAHLGRLRRRPADPLARGKGSTRPDSRRVASGAFHKIGFSKTSGASAPSAGERIRRAGRPRKAAWPKNSGEPAADRGHLRGLLLAVLAGRLREGHGLALGEGRRATLELGDVDEEIVAAFTLDEAVALVRAEPLYFAVCHVSLILSPHRGTNEERRDHRQNAVCHVAVPRAGMTRLT